MVWSELRGAIALVGVGALIALLFVALLDRTGTNLARDTYYPATTTTTTTTTTIDPRDDPRPVLTLCEAAETFVTSAESEAFFWPGKVPQLAETFYAAAFEVSIGDIAAEYAAALAYYEDYNDIAEPGNYDPFTLLRGPDADRFRQLAGREPPGVEATRANVAFLCGLDIPGPPIIPPDEFDELEDELADEQAEEQGR
ncbi:MAG: hypothetical protein OES57_04445 [Acidimicrobiia bacterium]|nr:hypothetical protein [Acidimicrobiia bacterium]